LRKVFRRLVSVDEAVRLLASHLGHLARSTEVVPVHEAVGRVLAEDIYAAVDVPPFPRAMRDGYAVRHDDLCGARETAPVKLRVVGRIAIGRGARLYVGRGEAVQVDTGSMVPGGATAVVMEEFVERSGDELLVYKQPAPGEYIQQPGADAFKGELLLGKGTVLTAREVGALAAAGIDRVRVYARPTAGIVSIGDELRYPGSRLSPGEIYDSNGPMIASALAEAGLTPRFYGIVPDDREALASTLLRAVGECDLVVTSGSTSAGLSDMLYKVVEEVGGTLVFHGVRQRPGAPMLVATLRGKPLVGLPGFPVSALMALHNVVLPALSLTYKGYVERRVLTARLLTDLRGTAGYVDLVPVVVRRGAEGYEAYPLFVESGSIATLQHSDSDGFVRIPEARVYLERGEPVDIVLFGGAALADVLFVSSHCVAIDRLVGSFASREGYSVKRLWLGSTAVFEGVKLGYCDAGGVHLLDPESGEYNIPYLERLGVKGAVLYKGYRRVIGLVVAKGNPHGVRSLGDIVEKRLRFVNRAVGSGTRALTDLLLRKYAEERGLSFEDAISSIEGYHLEAKTHSAVVSYVEAGLADVGVAIQAATVGRNVDFIPLAEERYDILVSRRALGREAVRRLVDYLFSDEARRILSQIPGITIDSDYGEVLAET